jgi:hypothetical protein
LTRFEEVAMKKPPPKSTPPDSAKDLTGKRFGKWVVLEYAGKKGCNRLWLCRCECGVEKNVSQGNLLCKLSTQCQRCAWTSRRNPYKKLSRVWRTLKQGRQLPEIWQDFDTFRKAVGNPPNDFARIGRYDISKPHGPGNTFWMTKESASQVRKIRQKLREESLQNKVLLQIRTTKTKDEKIRYIIAARKAGYTYELIGIAAGLTHQRVQQIFVKSME